jgi:antitoxin ParD1/3/4
MSTISISLPEALESFVKEQLVERGYGTSAEYLRDLIRMDQDRQRLRTLLLDGATSVASGTADDAYFESLRDRARLKHG